MKNIKEKSPNESVEKVSQKVASLCTVNTTQLLSLPEQQYQPFFLKVMHDFIAHNNLPKDLQLPSGNMRLSQALSVILDVIVRSMGEEKHREIIQELEEYKRSLHLG